MASTPYSEVSAQGNPIIAGSQVTFIWHGDSAPALIGDFTAWEQRPISLDLDSPGIWSATITLPENAYIEYTYWANGKPVRDPLNVRTVPDGYGGQNHYFFMPAGAPTPLRERKLGVPAGKIQRQVLKDQKFLADGKRGITFYQPPVSEPSPLLVVWDGLEYLERCNLNQIVDNLIHEGRIRPVAMALVESSPAARIVEYACSDATLLFLQNSLLPAAREHLNLLDPGQHPGAYGVMGASAGGLMALCTALRLPEVFGHALCQSGAYIIQDFHTAVWELVSCHQPPIKLWMDAGIYDSQLDGNRALHARLNEIGITHEFREYPGGHNFPAWRDDLSHGLEYLFGR